MPVMAIIRNVVEEARFNNSARLPYELRLRDFQMAMQDVYDFFYDVNAHLGKKGLQRLDDMLRPAIMSGVLLPRSVILSLSKDLCRLPPRHSASDVGR